MENKRIDYGVKAFIVYKGNFLVMHNNGVKEDLWELPGGRLEFGETAEKTVVRELLEEASILVKPIKILDTWDFIGTDYQITGIIYLCELIHGEVMLSSEHDAFKWLPLEEQSIKYMYDCFGNRMINWDWSNLVRKGYPDTPFKEPMETERKFLVKDCPDLKDIKNSKIEQLYLGFSPEVRIRSVDNAHFYLTFKSSGSLIRKEVEKQIDKQYYQMLKELADDKYTIRKTRYFISGDDFAFELDVYEDIPSLITVEIEFRCLEDAKDFIPPNWIGEEITYNSEYKNKNLWKRK